MEEKATEKRKDTKSLTIHGTPEEIQAYGERLKFVIPGGENLSALGAVRAADYARSIDANLFRGEIYAWEDGKGLHITEGYKLLVRWARRQCDFYDKEERLTPEEMLERGLNPEEDIAYRVWVLRQDKLQDLVLLASVVGRDEAYRTVAQCGIGVVTKAHRTQRDGSAKDPPVTWTWDDVAAKDALKMALKKAYGVPSPREIADESWRVGDVRTQPGDWEVSEGDSYTPDQRALLAAANARERERAEAFAQLTPEAQAAKVAQNGRQLYGDPDFEGFDTPPETTATTAPMWEDELVAAGEDEPEPEPTPAPKANGTATNDHREPLSAEEVRGVIRKKAGWNGGRNLGEPITEKQTGYVASLMADLFPDLGHDVASKARYDVLGYLFGVDSTKRLTKAEASALIDWMTKDPDTARIEAARIIKALAIEAGQQELPL